MKSILNLPQNQLDREVKQMMLGYPCMFPSRLECLCHMFTTTGTGYDWNDKGQLVKAVYEGVNDVELTKIEMPGPVDPDGSCAHIQILQNERETLIRQFTQDNIDFLAADYNHTGSRYSVFNVYPMGENPDYTNMVKAIDQAHLIDFDYLRGISELCAWILSETRGVFHHIERDADVNLADAIPHPRSLQNYTIAKKVYRAVQAEITLRNFRKI